MTNTFAAFSASVSQCVASAAPLLAAIRIGPNRHITGLVCQGDIIVTTDQALPALESYTVVLSNRLLLEARPGPRNPDSNLAVLRLESPWPTVNPEVSEPSVGSLVVVVGADADATPNARITAIHRFVRTPNGIAPVLDLSAERLDEGSLVLDPDGRLVGLAGFGPSGEAMAIPSVMIGRMLMPNQNLPAPLPTASIGAATPSAFSRRAWLGVALQPITVPEQLVARAGQPSGRMVVSITKGGPAEIAGMRIGDVVLALNGTSISGPQALRAFLAGDRIGTTVDVKLLRDGNVVMTHLTVAAQPN